MPARPGRRAPYVRFEASEEVRDVDGGQAAEQDADPLVAALEELCRYLGLQPAVPLLWLLITFAVVAVALVFGGGGSGACTKSWPAICHATGAAHSSPPGAYQTPAGRAPHATG